MCTLSHLNDALRLTKNAINYSHLPKMQATSLQHSALHRTSQVRPELDVRVRGGSKELTHRLPFAGLQLLLCFNDGIAQQVRVVFGRLCFQLSCPPSKVERVTRSRVCRTYVLYVMLIVQCLRRPYQPNRQPQRRAGEWRVSPSWSVCLDTAFCKK